jgi:geranylgeranyl pyrophosphate synthase
MIRNKTGGLLRLALHLLVKCSSSAVDCGDVAKYEKLVNLLGIHFQIRDDYMNLKSTDYTDLKGFAEDLTEVLVLIVGQVLLFNCVLYTEPPRHCAAVVEYSETKDAGC